MPAAEASGRVRLDLALVGFGHVGRRLVTLLDERRARLLDDHALECRIVGIATRRHGTVFAPRGLDPARACDLVTRGASLAPLQDPGAGSPPADALDLIGRVAAGAAPAPRDGTTRPVVVEMSVLNVVDGRPALDHVRAALDAGLDVVTVNKGPAAFAYRSLRALARQRGVAFLCEGAVLDGAPVFNLVRETLPTIQVVGFRGVLNTTTNPILTAMEAGRAFDEALQEMQAAGIAEADASLDVDGWDAAAKTAALINVLMDGDVTPEVIERRGIRHLTADAVRAARSRGRRLKLVASAARHGEVVKGRVAPAELPADDLLAGLAGPANALVIRTDLLGELAIVELDSGLTHTAFALLSDLVAVRRRP